MVQNENKILLHACCAICSGHPIELLKELKELNKPFIVLVNSRNPYSEETRRIVEEIKDKYNVSCMPISCENIGR